MIHAREDYNRIQDPEGKIPDDEPVFLLRAQDELCVATILYYIRCRMDRYGTEDEIAEKLIGFIHQVQDWKPKKKADL